MSRGPDPTIKREDVLRVFLSDPSPAFVPAEIAAELDCTTEGARHQMNRLVDQGYLGKKKPQPQTVIYWITDAGEQAYFEADA